MTKEDQNELQPISDVLLEWRFRNDRDKIIKQIIASKDDLINKQRNIIDILVAIIIPLLLYYTYKMLC